MLNLPLLLTVPDIGLNGILITPQQDSREFTIVADPQAGPLEQTLYVTARGEVNSGEPVDQASTPITLRVVAEAKAPSELDGAPQEVAIVARDRFRVFSFESVVLRLNGHSLKTRLVRRRF